MAGIEAEQFQELWSTSFAGVRKLSLHWPVYAMGSRDAAKSARNRSKCGMVQFTGVWVTMSPFAPRKLRCFRGAKGDFDGRFLQFSAARLLPRFEPCPKCHPSLLYNVCTLKSVSRRFPAVFSVCNTSFG